MSAAEKKTNGSRGKGPRAIGIMKGPALTLVFLLVILAVNVAAAFLNLGGYQLALNIVLAVASVAIIGLFFMHLKTEPSLNRLAALAGFLWLSLFFMLVFSDYFTRVVHPF